MDCFPNPTTRSDRPRILRLAAACALLLAPGPTHATEPNVLMIVADDLRPQLGCYGDPIVRTPNIDRLAARGLAFGQAYCQVALCSPSRISVLSGLRPSTTGIFSIGPTLRSRVPDVVTLPQLFKEHGYVTRSLGKVYHVNIDDPPSWSVPPWHSEKPRYGPDVTARLASERGAIRETGRTKAGFAGSVLAGPVFQAPMVDDDDLRDGDTAREAVDVLRELARNPEQPFFLGVGFSNPHIPWVAPKKYWDPYDGDRLPLPEDSGPPQDAPPFAIAMGKEFLTYSNVPEDGVLTPEFSRQCLQGYLAAISYLDELTGRMLDALEDTGLDESTLVVLWGDNGCNIGEHGWWATKNNTYESATRAPLIFAPTGRERRGMQTLALVEFVDIYPSLAEAAGLPVPETVEGTSFAPLLERPDRPWKTAALSECHRPGHHGTALRTERFRYIEWTDHRSELVAIELYDHDRDPQENQNLAATADPALLAALAEQLRAGWQGALPAVDSATSHSASPDRPE